ncbi:MAG: helix-turn-helix transcriptional regulator [Rhodobacteraceae bacterium]|nr:helix-turn-helix transcriptional regulator [Paracoccaceae bacterium]
MTEDIDLFTSEEMTEEVINRLYEVVVDPMRYEDLLDRWEELMRAGSLLPGDAPDLSAVANHVQRAGQALDRVISESGTDAPGAVLDKIGNAAAFALGRDLTVLASNAASAAALGIGPGASIHDMALGPGETAVIALQTDRLFVGNSNKGIVLRLRAAHSDRLMLVHMRAIRPEAGPAYILIVTSELAWPSGFTELLRGAFDLTPAEAEVMRALAEGHSPAEIARARARSIETIRAQLKTVMSKTETRSQSELVRLTLSTMDIARFSDDAAANLPEGEAAQGTLLKRDFNTLHLDDGRQLDYLILGDPNGKPVLFLPLDFGLVRWPASAEAEATRAGIKIIVVIRPGFGNSTSLPRGTPYIAQLVDDHVHVLEHLQTGPVPIVSLGGDSYIAMALHAAYPEKFKALIACAGVLPFARPAQYERMQKWHRFILAGARYTPQVLPFMVKAGFALARRLGKRGFMHAIYGDSQADVNTFKIPEVFEAIIVGSQVTLSDSHMAHDAFTREVISHETADWSSELVALKQIPVHFLNGLQDPQVPVETLAEYQQDYPWISFRKFPDAGQLLFFLKWREVIALTLRYLD